MTEDRWAVRASNLTKSYDSMKAVSEIDFEIRRGEAFGFLGPNGAGKSTTMRMIYRASPISEGHLEILGFDAKDSTHDREIKKRIGVIHQENNLDEELTVQETLEVFCRFYGLTRAETQAKANELMEFADLRERAHHRIITLSGGMKRRLMVARGLIGQPELVVLDEPTTGLDPRARQTLWKKLSQLRQRDTTLIITTHYMEEAERLCDRVAIMDRSQIVTIDTPANLIQKHAAPCVVEIEESHLNEESRHALSTIPDQGLEHFGGRVLLYGDDGERMMTQVVHATGGQPAYLRRGTLEDVFLRMTGHSLDG